jgi:uncharacterized protein YbjT (DUF2867 family)
MKVILFGATGMVGQGVLRECLRDPAVSEIVCIGRTPTGGHDSKLRDVIHKDFTDFSAVEDDMAGADACFFCLGVSSAGMSEARYTRVTYDFTMAAAYALVALNPKMVFIYVSGMGTDSSEQGRTMWARVKGRTENALLRLPFRAFMFRPGVIRPMHGIRSKTALYRALYVAMGPLLSAWQKLAPATITTTDQVGRAMIQVALKGYRTAILETRDINSL